MSHLFLLTSHTMADAALRQVRSLPPVDCLVQYKLQEHDFWQNGAVSGVHLNT